MADPVDPALTSPGAVPRAEAFRFWIKLGFLSFGGPAGQIALMHREVVDRRRWVSEREFLEALNFCMLLPGPEALQLAIFLGRRLHGTAGGLVAGLGFFLPAVVLLFVLSFVYVLLGRQPLVAGALFGLKAVVVALVFEAVIRLARRATQGWPVKFVAIGAFALLHLLDWPFPLVLLLAAAIGAISASAGRAATPAVAAAPWPAFPWRPLVVGSALWLVPLMVLLPTLGSDALLTRLYLVLSQVALVTFGGAYAVLAYVNDLFVAGYGWLTPSQAVEGLALAEATPGPLVIVLQFFGFIAAWNEPGALAPALSASVGALLAVIATFLPSFVLIFIGAPYVERLSAMPRLAGALQGVTAAVVGVITSLAVTYAGWVLFPTGWRDGPNLLAALLAITAFAVLTRTKVDPLWVIAGGALLGAGLAAWQ